VAVRVRQAGGVEHEALPCQLLECYQGETRGESIAGPPGADVDGDVVRAGRTGNDAAGPVPLERHAHGGLEVIETDDSAEDSYPQWRVGGIGHGHAAILGWA